MATPSYKAIATARQLKDNLGLRFPAVAVAESVDADGFPTIRVGTGIAGAPGAFIRIKQEASINTDVIGHTQTVFTPHIIQLALEANYAGADDSIADVNSWSLLLPLVAECILPGTKVEMWLEANGTAPSATTFATPAKKVASFDSLIWPLVGTI